MKVKQKDSESEAKQGDPHVFVPAPPVGLFPIYSSCCGPDL